MLIHHLTPNQSHSCTLFFVFDKRNWTPIAHVLFQSLKLQPIFRSTSIGLLSELVSAFSIHRRPLLPSLNLNDNDKSLEISLKDHNDGNPLPVDLLLPASWRRRQSEVPLTNLLSPTSSHLAGSNLWWDHFSDIGVPSPKSLWPTRSLRPPLSSQDQTSNETSLATSSSRHLTSITSASYYFLLLDLRSGINFTRWQHHLHQPAQPRVLPCNNIMASLPEAATTMMLFISSPTAIQGLKPFFGQ